MDWTQKIVIVVTFSAIWLLSDSPASVFIPGDVLGQEESGLRKRLPHKRSRPTPPTPSPNTSEARPPAPRDFGQTDTNSQENSRSRRRLPSGRSRSIPGTQPPSSTSEQPSESKESDSIKEKPRSKVGSALRISKRPIGRIPSNTQLPDEAREYSFAIPTLLDSVGPPETDVLLRSDEIRTASHTSDEEEDQFNFPVELKGNLSALNPIYRPSPKEQKSVLSKRVLLAQSDESRGGRRLPSGRSRPDLEKSNRQVSETPEQAGTPEELAAFQRSNFIPIRDRWRIGYTGSLLDPYAQNLLKADYPIIGQDIFFNFTGISESLFEARKLPTPQGISRRNSGSSGEFFGKGRQLFFNQNFVTSFEIFKGDTGFRPRDWAVRVTPVFNLNYLDVRERGIVNLDVREGTTRTDHQIAFQEAFVEYKFFDVSRNFDFASVRAGIQGFTSDFRGFIFADNEPGIRFFGNFLNNRYQWNIAYFNFLEKDTNSMLNSFESRHRQVVIANIYKQDFIWKGYTAQFSFHYDRDEAGDKDSGGGEIDSNGFPVRPARLGTLRPNNISSYYLGWTGDGHIGRINISHAFYQVFGDVDQEPIAGRSASINAQMAALELSYDIDWWRPKVSVFYGSGDRNPTDGTARGFDSILDNVNFAGNGFSFYNRQGLPLSQTGVFLVNRLSLLNDFRSSKIQGQSQFVNPGIILVNAGVDVEATPKLKVLVNFNYLWFATTAPIEHVLNQPNIRQEIGQDYSIGFIYRPLLNQNIILTAGFAYLVPNGGLKDIQGGDDLYSTFFSAVLTF